MAVSKRQFQQRRAIKRVRKRETFEDKQREIRIRRAVRKLSGRKAFVSSSEAKALTLREFTRSLAAAGTQGRRVSESARASGLAPLLQSRIEPRSGRFFLDVFTSQLLGDTKRVKRLFQRKARRSKARRRQNTRVRVKRQLSNIRSIERAKRTVAALRSRV